MARSTAQRVAMALRERIEGGELPPGTQLSEEALGRDLEVSRNTLREAFRLLIHESLVEHLLNRGVFVRVPTAADVTDVYRMRTALETAGVRAAATAPAPLRAAVAASVDEGERAAAEGDWRQVGSADLRFHRALAALVEQPAHRRRHGPADGRTAPRLPCDALAAPLSPAVPAAQPRPRRVAGGQRIRARRSGVDHLPG
ncbi:hypothetical protein GCM10020000_68620 [Streptomyces olivoverticillatus]